VGVAVLCYFPGDGNSLGLGSLVVMAEFQGAGPCRRSPLLQYCRRMNDKCACLSIRSLCVCVLLQYLALTQLGRSALVRADEKGRSHTVEVLVQGGANPNIQDEVS